MDVCPSLRIMEELGEISNSRGCEGNLPRFTFRFGSRNYLDQGVMVA
jgi:hypothetical protein